MLVLTIRTDKPEAEIGLFESREKLAYETWTAHRSLGLTIYSKIDELLRKSGKKLPEVQAIVAYKGPGSFTGLRIGLTVGNTLAYALPCKIAGATGEEWIMDGIAALLSGKDEGSVMPEYGGEVHITQPRK